MFNRVDLIGNLGRHPEVRTFQNGDKVANLSLATSERWKDSQTGERRERTEWHRVAVFGPLADVCDRYLRKGSKIHVVGKLETRKWQDKSGQDRFTTEVVVRGFGGVLNMLDTRDTESSARGEDDSPAPPHYTNRNRNGASYPPGGDHLDDEIPF